MSISRLELLRGKDVVVSGIKLRQPLIDEITDQESRERYNQAVGFISIGVVEILKSLGLSVEEYLKLSEEDRKQITYFSLLQLIPDIKEQVLTALAFFVIGNVEFDEEQSCFVVSNDDGQMIGVIGESNIDEVRNAILQICCFRDSAPPTKFRNEKARQIYYKCQERKAKMEAAKKKDDISIENVVSSVAAKSPTYNLFNIFNLTLYQLYDQFAVINKLNQLDVIALRWAAYGEDDFDWALWYSDSDKN